MKGVGDHVSGRAHDRAGPTLGERGGPVSEKLRTGEYDGEPPDVLVIDDDEDVRWALLELLQLLGLVGIGASNGAQGLRLAEDRPPRAILLDLRMPVMDGWQFLEYRRSSSDLLRVPVVVITAETMDVAMGPDVHRLLRKPIGEDELRVALDGLTLAPRASATVS
jgi:CheY-like chemotaxis protein